MKMDDYINHVGTAPRIIFNTCNTFYWLPIIGFALLYNQNNLEMMDDEALARQMQARE
jgi:hypothetical protein